MEIRLNIRNMEYKLIFKTKKNNNSKMLILYLILNKGKYMDCIIHG